MKRSTKLSINLGFTGRMELWKLLQGRRKDSLGLSLERAQSQI
jgi:hypothetical protein